MNKSKQLYQKALTVMPGGVSSPVRAFKAVKNTPIFITRGHGPYLYDVDGRAYIDYVMSFGPLILGHSNPAVVSSVTRALHGGTSFGAPIPDEISLAERMIEYNSSLHWVRFVNSGTEAVMSAIRLARGATGRTRIVKFWGCYHGHVDSLLVKAGSGLATFSIASSAGVPASVVNDTIVLSLGDEESLRNTFSDMGDEIAAVIIEGVPANMGLFPQSRSYMKLIQDLCREHGSLFILDEVITGFRVSRGGAVEYYGDIEPDIVVYGKIIGGGLPVGAYGGRADLIEHVAPNGNVYQAGTLSGNPLAMSAGLSTLSALDEELYHTLEENTSILCQGVKDLGLRHGISLHVTQVSSILWFVLQEAPVHGPGDITSEAEENYSIFHRLALEEGLYMPPSAYEVCFISASHTPAVIDETLQRLERVFQRMGGDGV